MMPSFGKLITATVQTNSSALRTMVIHIFNSGKGDYSYAVMYLDGLGAAATPDFFDFTKEYLLKSKNAKLLSHESIRYGQHVGRAITAAVMNGRGRLTGREFLIGKRYYMLAVVSPIQDIPRQAIDRFFSSFKVEGNTEVQP